MKEKLDVLVLGAWLADTNYFHGIAFLTLYKINEAMEKVAGKIFKYNKKEKPLDNQYLRYIGVEE